MKTKDDLQLIDFCFFRFPAHNRGVIWSCIGRVQIFDVTMAQVLGGALNDTIP
jgi:hypothetical protein